MECRKFKLPYDYEDMRPWYNQRGLPSPRLSQVPEHGMVVLERGELIAVAFLRMVEGGYAHFDGLVTNPDAPSDLRHSAIDLLSAQTIELAKELKLKGLIAHSTDENTLTRSAKHGFIKSDAVLVVLDLE